MSKNNYQFYKDFIKKGNYLDTEILISRTKNSYLIGPLIDSSFNKNSFCKRITSNSIYSLSIYKRVSRKKARVLIERYKKELKSNEVIEIFKNGEIIKHFIIPVPGANYEKK